MKSEALIALTQLAAERHLPKEQVLQAIEVALASAFKKDSPAVGQNITVKFNPNTGDVHIYALKTVVEAVTDPIREISLRDAQSIKKTAALGDEIAEAEPLPYDPSRIAAQTAKQVVLQRLREAERELVYQEFMQHQGDIISGVVEQMDGGRTIMLDMGRAQAVLPADEQVPTERYKKGQRVKVYVLDVRRTAKGPEILVSRSHKNMLKRLFEIEVPEVYNGVVEIKAIAREAGYRSKVAVSSTQQGIDPVGSCIGIRGNRIQSIVNELQGEKIDVVPWDKDPRVFIAKALSPSEVIHVEPSPPEQVAMVVVPDRQLSLAIGREGQNARLAARLTGWRLDIKGLTEWEEIKAARQLKIEEARRLQAERRLEEQRQQAMTGAEQAEEAAAAVAAAEAIVAASVAAVPATPEVPEEATIATTPELVPVAEAPAQATLAAEPVEQSDEEALLETLIREEEEAARKAQEVAEPQVGLSIEELDTFTLETIDGEYAVDSEEEETDSFPDISPAQVVTPDAGKIRFAEDIIGDYRGGDRRDRRATQRGPQRSGRGGHRRTGGR
jgi:N utilization substance protein A